MSTTFIYYSEGVSEEKVILNNTDSFFCLKKHIISKLKEYGNNNNIDYVDLIMILDKPIRDFGKLILEPGSFPRTMDQFTLDKFNLENREIKCEYIPVSDYKPKEIIKKKSLEKDSLYKLNLDNDENKKKTKKVFDLDLNSDNDFPALC